MTAGDRLALYEIFGLAITLLDGRRLHVRGPQQLRDIARPSILKHRDALVRELIAQRTFGTVADLREVV